MATLFSALRASAGALDVLNQSIDVAQNNVDNASTPGYAAQIATSEALPFDPASGLSGGVKSGPVESTRDEFAEQAVWQQQENLGVSNGMLDGLSSVQQLLNVTGQSGIPGALNQLFSDFSSWATEPDSSTARQQVLADAQTVAQSFNTVANGVQQASLANGQQIQSTVAQINQLSSSIAALNQQIGTQPQPDAGLEAQLYNNLEQLSQLVNINVLTQSNGTVTVLTGSESPLVMGQTAMSLSASASGNGYAILDSSGNDISSNITGGSLAGLLQFQNTVGGLIGNSSGQGSLNQLAQSLADNVNQILTAGTTDNSSTATAGIPLFTYTSGNTVAATLAVNPAITASTLAAASGGVANGAATALANLSSGTISSLGGTTLTDYYSAIASGIGTLQSNASNGVTNGQQLVAQAQNARSQISGVSLDAEAAQLMQLQQSYQAVAKMISVVDDLTQSVINMIQY